MLRGQYIWKLCLYHFSLMFLFYLFEVSINQKMLYSFLIDIESQVFMNIFMISEWFIKKWKVKKKKKKRLKVMYFKIKS